MAFLLGFTTTDYDEGKSILIEDNSTDWASMSKTVTQVRFTITSLYSGVTLTTTPVVKDIAIGGLVTFAEGFSYEITNINLFGAGSSDPVSDSIYHIEMTLYDVGGEIADAGYAYSSSEVYYFNALALLDDYLARKAAYVDTIDFEDQEYANWLDFLISTIESNTRKGNSSAIYYCFDTFKNL